MTAGNRVLSEDDNIERMLVELERLPLDAPLTDFHQAVANALHQTLGFVHYRIHRGLPAGRKPVLDIGSLVKETVPAAELDRAQSGTDAIVVRSASRTHFVVPLTTPTSAPILLELIHPELLAAAVERRLGHVVEAVGEILGDFLAKKEHEGDQQLAAQWPTISQALLDLQEASLLPAGGARIAAILQKLWRSDRVFLFARRGGGFRMTSASIPGASGKRTRPIRLMETLCERVADAGAPLLFVHGDPASQADPHLAGSLDPYVSEALVRRLRIVPIKRTTGGRRADLALVSESFATELAPETAVLEDATLPHAEQAIRSWSDRYQRGLWGRLLGSWHLKRTAKVLAIAALVAVGIGVSLKSQTEFSVQADGRLVPANRFAVFSPADGFVAELHVANGDQVRAGTPLARIQDSELDRAMQKVEGDLATWEARVSSIKTLRTQGQFRGNQTAADLASLSVEEEQLQVQIRGARRQLELMRDEQRELTVLARQDGAVDGWEIDQTLPHRPVRRGQHLFDVAQTDGTWQIELDIPDDVAGYVREANLDGSGRPVRFLLRSHPLVEYAGRLIRLDDNTEWNAGGQVVVRGIVEFDRAGIEAPQAGATVAAKIDCGQRSVAFVWLRRLLEYLYRTFLL